MSTEIYKEGPAAQEATLTKKKEHQPLSIIPQVTNPKSRENLPLLLHLGTLGLLDKTIPSTIQSVNHGDDRYLLQLIICAKFEINKYFR